MIVKFNHHVLNLKTLAVILKKTDADLLAWLAMMLNTDVKLIYEKPTLSRPEISN